MNITIPTRKPRNPLVQAARFRQAGTHAACRGSMRQRSAHALRRELDQLARQKYSP